VQPRPACAPDVKLDIVSEVDHFPRRTAELAAGDVKERGVGLARAVGVRRNGGVKQVIEPDLHETRIAVGKRRDAIPRRQPLEAGQHFRIQLHLVARGHVDVQRPFDDLRGSRVIGPRPAEHLLEGKPANRTEVVPELGTSGVDRHAALPQPLDRPGSDDLGHTLSQPCEGEVLGAQQRRLAWPQRIVEVQGDRPNRPPFANAHATRPFVAACGEV
jgi:hypothetical protein